MRLHWGTIQNKADFRMSSSKRSFCHCKKHNINLAVTICRPKSLNKKLKGQGVKRCRVTSAKDVNRNSSRIKHINLSHWLWPLGNFGEEIYILWLSSISKDIEIHYIYMHHCFSWFFVILRFVLASPNFFSAYCSTGSSILAEQLVWTGCVYNGNSLMLVVIAWEHPTVTTASGITEDLIIHVL